MGSTNRHSSGKLVITSPSSTAMFPSLPPSGSPPHELSSNPAWLSHASSAQEPHGDLKQLQLKEMGKSERNVAVSHKGQVDAWTLLLFNWSASTKPKVGELQRISHTGTNSSNSFLPPTEGKGPRNHTATGCFVLEETSKTHPPFNSCHRQGHLHLIRLPGCHLVWL